VNNLYHLTMSPPVLPGSDAVLQEVELLRGRFGGEVVWLRPAWRARARYPRPLLGVHHLTAIRRREKHVDLHHVYAPQLDWMPFLGFVKRPVVYTVATGLDSGQRMPPLSFLRRLGAIVVPSDADRDALTRQGLANVHVIRPGIDVTRFVDSSAPPGPDFVLLSGSAPWTPDQFRTKGVDVLLEAARELPDVRIVFLWRGLLLPELVAGVRRLELSARVEILHDWVDVSQVMARIHAAVVLAERPGLVKAYPHSLLEALAAGRPVVVSGGNPMAAYVRDTGCGRVLPHLEKADLIATIQELRRDYETYRARAAQVGRRDFSHEDFVAAHQELYGALVASRPRATDR
jgi:glycosyltransferase involved in cell wall biosynthesis